MEKVSPIHPWIVSTWLRFTLALFVELVTNTNDSNFTSHPLTDHIHITLGST